MKIPDISSSSKKQEISRTVNELDHKLNQLETLLGGLVDDGHDRTDLESVTAKLE